MNGNYLTSIHSQTGLSSVTLAFVLGGNAGCEPTWGGETPLSNKTILSSIQAFQKVGGSVILATGGAAGPYLESLCSTPTQLAAAYKKALDTVGTAHLDIDIGWLCV